jgi:hypothetical protein
VIRETADRHPEATRVELWFMDEARVGQKGRLTHVWHQKGVRPRGVWQQGFSSAHLFGAVCPERGEGVALVLPEVSTAAMDVFLAELGRAVPAGTHAALVLDGAGWHVSADLTVPANLTLVPLPPYSPELNPVERVWEHLRDRWLSHRVLADRGAVPPRGRHARGPERMRGRRGRRPDGPGATWPTSRRGRSPGSAGSSASSRS